MSQELIDFLSQFPEFSEEDIQGIATNLPVKIYKKGEYMIEEGGKNEFCYFILSGCARQYELLDGEEKTVGFYTEHEAVLIADVDENGASKTYVEALEKVVTIRGRSDNSSNMFGKFPQLQNVVMKLMEEMLSKTKLDFNFFVGSTPEEKYKKLMETRPDLFNRVPQHQIASFLGMKPETLSRIKKRVLNG